MKLNEVLRKAKDLDKGWKSLAASKVFAKKFKLPDGRQIEITVATTSTSALTKGKNYCMNFAMESNTSEHGIDEILYSSVKKEAIDKEILKKVIPTYYKHVQKLNPQSVDLSNNEAYRNFSNKLRDLTHKVLDAYEIVSKHMAKDPNDRQAKLNCMEELTDQDLEDYADL